MRAGSGDRSGMVDLTAAEAIRRAASLGAFPSGSPGIDNLLRGGFRRGQLTELFGRSGSGKTLLAAQTALLAARAGKRSLYVDTEGSFRPERLVQIADARGWGTANLLEKIVYVRSDSSSEQVETVRRMSARQATSACSLVVVDTLTRNFSVELPGKSNLSSRQAALNVHLSEMARDAYLNGRAYLVTNRVTFGTFHDVGIGGKTVNQLVHCSIRLEREDGRVRVTQTASGESVITALGSSGIE